MSSGCLLVEHPGDLVSRDKIMSAVWPGTVVEDGNLSVQISTLRRVLDHGLSEDSLIQTLPGRGYRFIGHVMRHDPAPPHPRLYFARIGPTLMQVCPKNHCRWFWLRQR
jgi:DNA-binding winged helix-turn-helix (wHTH) protein